jgi:hypothetical protein
MSAVNADRRPVSGVLVIAAVCCLTQYNNCQLCNLHFCTYALLQSLQR